MSDFHNDEEMQAARQAREKKVQSFKIDYSDGDYSPEYGLNEDYNRELDNNEINSYSGEDVKNQMEENSKRVLKKQKKLKKKEEKKKNRKNTGTFRFIWLISIVIVGAILAVYLLVGVNDMLAINRTDDATVAVELPASPTIDDVAKVLEDSGVINEASFFKLYASLTKSADSFNQGSFDIKTNLDYEAIINFIQGNANRKDIVSVTITEGQNLLEILDTLSNAGVVSDRDRFLELCNSDYFDEDFTFLQEIKNADKRYYKLEGYLYPDTYDFYLNEEPELTITRFLNNYEAQLYSKQTIDGYEKRVKISELAADSEYSMDEIINIASIIQAEAANSDDMYYISSVIHNRLSSDPDYGVASLGLDSTKFYPYRSKEKLPSDIKDSFKSTYDTYDFNGLPPGPICNPGREAILAAINPKDTNYLYFCHSSDGEPYYAETLEGHNYNLYLAGVEE